MTDQLLGKANYNFYLADDILVIMVTDSKSFSSVSIDPLVKLASLFTESMNIPREGKGNFHNYKTNTYQTYIWRLPIKKSN